ncbi:MAG: AbrB/MazE/SpoVT family DNA-binding domain-containing protein [Lentisphaeria bacterium]|nr:AbrB/MazE/SpoVT family DNA-binding domain-containing protein [Lentisphaeria bacterium]
MAMITAMSTRGQIVLPKKIRSALNLDAGTQFIVFSDQGTILLKPITEPKLSDFEAVLKKAKEWATETGLQESDINLAVKAVRRKKS